MASVTVGRWRMIKPSKAGVGGLTTIGIRRRQIGVGGFRITDRAQELVVEVLKSGRLTAGPMMARFEDTFAALHGCRYGLMCNSGTSALHIALAALAEIDDWQPGDEVIVPAVTFVATSNVVLHNGLKPVFVDVEPATFNIDPCLVEARITERTRAIMPVHVGGHPCNLGPVLEIARAHRLRVIEDCAEAAFATYHERPVGSFGDVSAFSTYAAHVVSTGVGGLCCSNDPEIIDVVRSFMNHGRDSRYIRIDDDDDVSDPARLMEVVDSRFSFIRLGHSFRATEMEAALGVSQLEERHDLCRRRREIAARYDNELADLSEHIVLPRIHPGCEHVYMFYAVVVRDPARRPDLVAQLERDGVETRYLLPLISQPVYRKLFGNLDAEYPVAARLNRSAFYVGCHPDMTDDDVDYVVASFHRALAPG